jgi:hypothetical protein
VEPTSENGTRTANNLTWWQIYVRLGFQWPELAVTERSGLGRENARFGTLTSEVLVSRKKIHLPVGRWPRRANSGHWSRLIESSSWSKWT